MKASIVKHSPVRMHLTAYETGDQPPDAVDLPPVLVRDLQLAQVRLAQAEQAIAAHLVATGQHMGRKR